MTGLDLFRSHIATLFTMGLVSSYDDRRAAQMVQDVEYDEMNIVQYATALASLYDDIYRGVKSGIFEASPDTLRSFSLYRSSRLPKFLYGLLSKVFDSSGVLHNEFCEVSFRTLLQSLALTRRVYSKTTTVHTHKAGVESYVNSQKPRAGRTRSFLTVKTLFWKVLLKEWDSHICWGDLGPGQVLDRDYPFERHLSLPALYGAPRVCQRFLEIALRRRFRHRALIVPGFNVDQLIAWLYTPECLTHPFVAAYAAPDQPSRLSTVEKDCRKDRPITVTYRWKAHLGACIRATGKNLLRSWGLEDCMNVDDQSLSHEFLRKNCTSAFTADMIDGSGNESEDELERSLPYIAIAELQHYSVTHEVKIPAEDNYSDPVYVKARTLQMGDSSCTFWLTTSMFFLQVASMLEKDFCSHTLFMTGGMQNVANLIDTKEFGEAEMRSYILRAGGLCQVVGDDFEGLEPYWIPFSLVCTQNNYRINWKKTSSPTDRLKESCGCWVQVNEDGSYTDLFPYRAPKIIDGYLNQTLVNITKYLHKIAGDELMCRLMTVSLAHYLGKDGHYLLSLSRNTDEIGSPYGDRVPTQVIPRNEAAAPPIDDDLKAFFRISEDLHPLLTKEDSRSKVQKYTRKFGASDKPHDGARFVASCPLSRPQRVAPRHPRISPPVSSFMRRVIERDPYASGIIKPVKIKAS